MPVPKLLVKGCSGLIGRILTSSVRYFPQGASAVLTTKMHAINIQRRLLTVVPKLSNTHGRPQNDCLSTRILQRDEHHLKLYPSTSAALARVAAEEASDA
jgi:hypothetical protein